MSLRDRVYQLKDFGIMPKAIAWLAEIPLHRFYQFLREEIELNVEEWLRLVEVLEALETKFYY